jgi:ADP-L-glycero-D-manno-heptose 6-epimerase
MKKIVVTGGAGFIGSALAYQLNNFGYTNILIVDRLDASTKWKNLVPLRFLDYIDADQFLSVIGQLDELDCIFHLGACSSTTEQNAKYVIDNNFLYTKQLATFAVSKEIKFIYASSAATYGDGSKGMEDSQQLDYLQTLRPLNPYGYSKHLFDLFAAKTSMFNSIVGLKYFNVFGPNEYHKGDMRSLVLKAYEQVANSGCISLFKSYNDNYLDGEFGRDFLYVKDAVSMTLHLFNNYVPGLYNIGSGEMNTWNRLAKAIFKALDKQPDIRYIEMPENIRGSYQYYTKADISKLRQTGFDSQLTPLEDAVADYVKNYLSGYKHLGE